MIKQIFISLLLVASSVIFAKEIKTQFSFPEVEYNEFLKSIVEVDIDGVWDAKKVNQKFVIESVQTFLKQKSGDKSENEWTRKSIKSILKNFTRYNIQCVGVVVDKEQKIWLNFLDKETGVESNMIVIMCDGGFWFWRIVVDPKTGKCTGLSINGEA